jgi:predicted house-cleaning noncanonical NTP pyrophosphatase (MazG superfamily)
MVGTCVRQLVAIYKLIRDQIPDIIAARGRTVIATSRRTPELE